MREWWQRIWAVFELIWIHRSRMIQRSFKDRRYGQALLFAFGALLYVGVYAFYYARNPGAFFLLLPGIAVAAWIARRHRTDDSTFPTMRSAAPTVVLPHTETHQGKAELIALRWFLYRRALSELSLKHHSNLGQTFVGTRAALLIEMKTLDLEKHWSDEERDLHLSPDGAWSEDMAVSVVARGAEVEALLWASGSLKRLLPVEDLHEVVRLPAKIPAPCSLPLTSHWRDSDEIRQESTNAFGAWLRVLAEAHSRGMSIGEVDDEFRAALGEIAVDGGEQNTDLVLGTKLVTEISDDELSVAKDN